MKYSFFSYSRVDSHFALKLANDLRTSGVNIWLDQLDINPGTHWDTSIETALKDATWLIVILSHTSLQSNNVMDEISFALENGKAVIPIKINECKSPLRLIRLQHIDFTKDYEIGKMQLLKILRKNELTKPKKEKQKVEKVEYIDLNNTNFFEDNPTLPKVEKNKETKKLFSELFANYKTLWAISLLITVTLVVIKFYPTTKRVTESTTKSIIEPIKSEPIIKSDTSKLKPNVTNLPANTQKNIKNVKVSENANRFVEKYRLNEYNLYSGNLVNGKPNGKGILYNVEDNSINYDGEFLNGKWNGYGKYFTSNQLSYEGFWKNSRRDGYGIDYGECGVRSGTRCVYKGTFNNDSFVEGEIIFNDNDKYLGKRNYFSQIFKYTIGSEYGIGTYKFSNGDTYTGQFKSCTMNGNGRYTWQNGDYFEGVFVENNIFGKGVLQLNSRTLKGTFKSITNKNEIEYVDEVTKATKLLSINKLKLPHSEH